MGLRWYAIPFPVPLVQLHMDAFARGPNSVQLSTLPSELSMGRTMLFLDEGTAVI